MGKAVEILSNLKVRNLGPGLHRDGGGLVLVVDAGGSRNWGFVYREPYTKDKFGNGKRTKLGLGVLRYGSRIGGAASAPRLAKAASRSLNGLSIWSDFCS